MTQQLQKAWITVCVWAC